VIKKKGTSESTAKVQAPDEEEQVTAPIEAAAKSEQEIDSPIVGIGASAGGLAAFEAFFSNMPAATESGMAFVLVQHLDPDHKSILTDLIRRYTQMQVYEVADGMEIQPNCAYIIPPNKDMAFMHGRLHLMDPVASRGRRLPIDYFFRSLAQDRHERAICIVLSGTGTDGTLGLKEIKGQGGMAMVQAPETTEYDGMPRSAIATGVVDYVLPPAEMPAQLIAYVDHAFGRRVRDIPPPAEKAADSVQKILFLLRGQTGHDFSHYKQNTVHRRIERRMAVNQIGQLENYVRYLQQNPSEVDNLFRDLLIGVTSFFRDPEAFEALRERSIIPLLSGRDPRLPLRIWVPGCSTGEEAYSIAILIQETMDTLRQLVKVQVFATDIDAEAVECARNGMYPDSIAADVSSERLARFFRQENGTYHMQRSIRDMVVFATQNIVEDPPFSRIDLISCRNLLIYMGPELQKKVTLLFQYALNPDGYLFLGSSETVGEFVDLFAVVDRKWKLFQRKNIASRYQDMPDFLTPPRLALPATPIVPGKDEREEQVSIRELAEKDLLEEHTPACAIVNEKGQVLYIHGHTGRYLEPALGEASLDIVRMAREGLRLELATALRKVSAQKTPVHYPGLQVKADGKVAAVDLLVKPVLEPSSMRGLTMVLFIDAPIPDESEAGEAGPALATDVDRRIAELERELRAKEEHLQTTIEELETSNEELRSTNEELQSSNEELQSTSEEMETSKEELQSVNEELTTVNVELQQKIDEFSRINNDMSNLLAGTDIGTVFVDEQMRILRFTPAATKTINLIQSDVGRPVSHIVSNLDYANLVEDIQAVLDTLTPREAEAQADDGQWYLVRILPYRTLENAIQGAVLTFVNITEQKQVQEQLRQATRAAQKAQRLAESIVETVREPLVVLDGSLRVTSANPAFYQYFLVDPEETVGQYLRELGDRQWDIPQLRELLEKILPEQTTFHDFRVEHEFERIGRRTILLNAREIRSQDEGERMILLAMEVSDEKG
jgi:two-component system CheB/CheR fusion protein